MPGHLQAVSQEKTASREVGYDKTSQRHHLLDLVEVVPAQRDSSNLVPYSDCNYCLEIYLLYIYLDKRGFEVSQHVLDPPHLRTHLKCLLCGFLYV